MAEEPNDEQLLHRLFEQITEHLETRWAYFSVTSTEKISKIAASVVGAVVIFVFAVLVLFFFSMGFAWWLGDFIGHRAGGFALAGLVFVPIGYFFFHWSSNFVRNQIIESALNQPTNNQSTNNQQNG